MKDNHSTSTHSVFWLVVPRQRHKQPDTFQNTGGQKEGEKVVLNFIYRDRQLYDC